MLQLDRTLSIVRLPITSSGRIKGNVLLSGICLGFLGRGSRINSMATSLSFD